MPRQKSLIRTTLEPLAIAIALAVVVRAALHLYSIPSESMTPTLVPGDQIVVVRYSGGAPQRGDVIVFESPADRKELLVKRVVAVPGDLVDSRLGRVRIGGYTLPEPYLSRQASSGAISAQIVPADSYFVLGDNRDDSLDSRSWGYVPRSLVVGRARLILWSSDSPIADAVNAAVTDRPGESRSPSSSRSRLFKWVE